MIAFAVIFDRELPVGIHRQDECAVGSAMIHRLIEFGPAGNQIRMDIFKRGGIAVDVDKDGFEPDMAAYFDQAQQRFINCIMRIPAAEDLGSGHTFPMINTFFDIVQM